MTGVLPVVNEDRRCKRHEVVRHGRSLSRHSCARGQCPGILGKKIVKIERTSGSTFDFDDFLAKDARALSSGAVMAAQAPAVPYDFVPLAPPVLIDNR